MKETHKFKDLKVRFVPTPFSPLLANIALDGMIWEIQEMFPKSIYRNKKQLPNYRPTIIRYADDFVVIHRDL